MKYDKKKTVIALTILAIITLISFLILYFIKGKNEDIPQKNIDKFEIVNDYITFFTIEKNINNFIVKTNSNYVFESSEIYKWHFNDKINAYYATGNIYNSGYEDESLIEKDKKYLVLNDVNNFSIEIIECDNYDEALNKMNKLDKNYTITKNSNNRFEGGNIVSSNDICIMYLSDFIKKIYMSPQDYYSLIDGINSEEELQILLKEKDFSTIVKSCETSSRENNRYYIINDSNGNVLRFNEKSVRNYSVQIIK